VCEGLRETGGTGDWCGGAPEDGSAAPREARGEVPRGWVSGLVRGGGGAPAPPPVVALDESQQHVREVVAGLAVEPPHDAEIDGADIAVGIDEHVAGMLVGMEIAVAEHLVEEDRGGLGKHARNVMAGGEESVAVPQGDAGEAVWRHPPAGRAPPVDGRYAVTWVAGEVGGEFRGGGGLEPQIHLHANRLGKGLDDGNGLQAPQLRLRAF